MFVIGLAVILSGVLRVWGEEGCPMGQECARAYEFPKLLEDGFDTTVEDGRLGDAGTSAAREAEDGLGLEGLQGPPVVEAAKIAGTVRWKRNTRGVPGYPGEKGDPGWPGMDGMDGMPGRPGPPGPPGSGPCPTSRKKRHTSSIRTEDDSSQLSHSKNLHSGGLLREKRRIPRSVGLPGYPGEMGDTGKPGYLGRPGPPGPPGPPGVCVMTRRRRDIEEVEEEESEVKWSHSANLPNTGVLLETKRDKRGSVGMVGPPGMKGYQGLQGVPGFPGPPGPPGLPGMPGCCDLSRTKRDTFPFVTIEEDSGQVTGSSVITQYGEPEKPRLSRPPQKHRRRLPVMPVQIDEVEP